MLSSMRLCLGDRICDGCRAVRLVVRVQGFRYAVEVERHVAQVVQGSEWWWRVDGAYWRMPEGPGSGVDDRADHPVTHVSWTDAMAYCDWIGGRMPTEAEWEYAARGGLDQARFAWGDELEPNGEHMCNIWQGEFPNTNALEDGWHGTSPVASYPANDFGLYDVAGNVWEWCSDWFSPTFHRNARRVTRDNPERPPQWDGEGDTGRLLSLSRFLLQSLPRRRSNGEHARLEHWELGFQGSGLVDGDDSHPMRYHRYN